jgi:hypothetical protein
MRQPSFQGLPSVPDKTLELNTAYSQSLNYPSPKATARKLAVVGGGKSVQDHLLELQKWDGEIWGINGAAGWLRGNFIDATLFTISPTKAYPREYLRGITRAILADHCDPWLFDDLKRVVVSTFDSDGNGPTSVCAAIPLSLNMGYEEVSIFGCEGSYDGQTHIYQDTKDPSEMLVRIGGNDYLTNIGYFIQTRLLAHFISGAPNYCKDRSGGMLSALVADPEGWDVIKLPSELREECQRGKLSTAA